MITDTGRMACEDKRIEVIHVEAKECERLPSKYQKLGEKGSIPLRIAEETWPCQHLGFRLLVSKTTR